ncbi:MAG: virulence factor family protein, partial [Gammaproteobacteria bacterium]|nr:virulence factor family protein [Gammaproteobacteria bacterium]
VGHSAGATLAVVALAQAPRGSFRGALTLAFCPELDLTLPVCPSAAVRSSTDPQHRGQRLRAAGALPAPWIDLHGLQDSECPAAPARAFAAQVPNAQFLPLPGVGHTFGSPRSWWPQFRAGFTALVRPDPVPAVAARGPLP